MPYVTYVEIAELDKNLSNENFIARAQVEAFARAASSIVDSFLQQIYEVPLTAPYPEIVIDIARALTIAKCYRHMTVATDTEHSRGADELKKDAMDLLEKLQARDIKPNEAFRPMILLPGVPFRSGIMETEPGTLLYMPNRGRTNLLWGSNLNGAPRRSGDDWDNVR